MKCLKGASLLSNWIMTTSDITIRVSDSGKGIPEENLPNIFDPFFSTKIRGTGMGLPIVLRIIKNYGGKIEVAASGKKWHDFPCPPACAPMIRQCLQ